MRAKAPKIALPAIGAVGWGRYGKRRVAGIVEGHVVARVYGGCLIVMTATEWGSLLPHEWTQSDIDAADAAALRGRLWLRDPTDTVTLEDDVWVVRHRRNLFGRAVFHANKPVRYEQVARVRTVA